jgi:hypothetical protein
MSANGCAWEDVERPGLRMARYLVSAPTRIVQAAVFGSRVSAYTSTRAPAAARSSAFQAAAAVLPTTIARLAAQTEEDWQLCQSPHARRLRLSRLARYELHA